jgi:hypothetical protein
VFPHVRLFRDHAPAQGPAELGNLIFFASESELSFDVPRDAEFENDTCRELALGLASYEVLDVPPPGAHLTDERNALPRLQLAIADDHFVAMQRLLPRELWLP